MADSFRTHYKVISIFIYCIFHVYELDVHFLSHRWNGLHDLNL